VGALLDLAHKDHVVALFVAAAVEAFKRGSGARQQRRTADTLSVGHAGPAIDRF